MIRCSILCRCLGLAIALVLLAGMGCSSDTDRSRVQGAISYNGEQVDEGGIGFIPDGESTTALRATGEIKDGRYSLDGNRGPTPGKYRVEIYWNKKTGKTITGASGATKDERAQVIPAKYNTNTELKVEVKSGRNTFDFDLKP